MSALEHERTVIERQVKHLTRLVDDLLDVSRIASGKVTLTLQHRRDRRGRHACAIEIVEPPVRGALA
jgi:signal transduction histidine kinase